MKVNVDSYRKELVKISKELDAVLARFEENYGFKVTAIERRKGKVYLVALSDDGVFAIDTEDDS